MQIFYRVKLSTYSLSIHSVTCVHKNSYSGKEMTDQQLEFFTLGTIIILRRSIGTETCIKSRI